MIKVAGAGTFAALFLLMSVTLAQWSNWQFHEDACKSNIWPIFAGGTSQDLVNCFAYHPKAQMIVIGGNTTSADFAPAANEHGYLYALDMEGNFMWGRFFYNVSYAVSDITGCQLSSDGETLSVLA